MSTFTPEKIRELIYTLDNIGYTGVKVQKITEWLEQNQPEPQVVGLSDEQVESLTDYIGCSADTITKVRNKIVGWLKTQTFAQLEEVPVGLSDEQIASLIAFLRKEGIFSSALNHASYINEWQDTQSFKNRQITNFEFAYNSLLEDNTEMTKELEQLKSQSQPNWDDAPEWANWLAQDMDGQWKWFSVQPSEQGDYFSSHGFGEEGCAKFIKNWQQTLQQRQKLTQQVEVGQVWNALGIEFEVTQVVLGGRDYEIMCASNIGVIHKEKFIHGFTYQGTLEEFITKFERVS